MNNAKIQLSLTIKLIIGLNFILTFIGCTSSPKKDMKSLKLSDEETSEIRSKSYFIYRGEHLFKEINLKDIEMIDGESLFLHNSWFNLYRNEYYIKYDWINENNEIFWQTDGFFYPNSASWNTRSRLVLNSSTTPLGILTVKIYLNNRFITQKSIHLTKKSEKGEPHFEY